MSQPIVTDKPAATSSTWAVLRPGRPGAAWAIEACCPEEDTARQQAAALRNAHTGVDYVARNLTDPTIPTVAPNTPHTATADTPCAWCHKPLGDHTGKWFEVKDQFVGDERCARSLYETPGCIACGARRRPRSRYCLDCGPAAGGLISAARSAPQVTYPTR